MCGKEPDVAALQDLLVHALRGLSLYAVEGQRVGVKSDEINRFACKALFATLTNVDFDPDRIAVLIQETVAFREQLKTQVGNAGGKTDFADAPANFQLAATVEDMVKQGEGVGLKSDPDVDPDILALQHTLLFGIKGVSAYADHAAILGKEDSVVYDFLHEGLVAPLNKDLGLEDWVGLVLRRHPARFRFAINFAEETPGKWY